MIFILEYILYNQFNIYDPYLFSTTLYFLTNNMGSANILSIIFS